jgi:hypothetical protein
MSVTSLSPTEEITVSTTMPLTSIPVSGLDRPGRSAPASRQAHSTDSRAGLWIVAGIVTMMIVAGGLLPAPANKPSTVSPTWVVGL